jgi:DNA (cytosine-5)-methyltransferase 1
VNYYNEKNPDAAQWIRNLIDLGAVPRGIVDDRSIEDVHPSDLDGFVQCHFFAGIAGWSLALQLAGWPEDRPVWTGSCPCQPFSAAGEGLGFADERHLWPAFFHLIEQRKPSDVLGEQVAREDGLAWLDLVFADLGAAGYATGAANLCAAGVGAPHSRQRLYWVAHAANGRREGLQRSPRIEVPKDRAPQALDAWHGTGDPFEDWPKLLAGTCIRSLADGVPSTLEVRPALRAYGNAIVPQVAQAFIESVMETTWTSAQTATAPE